MNNTAEAMHQLRSLSQSRSPELSLAPVLPPALPLQCYCFSPSLFPVSSSWQLVSITVILPALGCAGLMVHQQVKQQHRASPTKVAPTNSQFMSLSYMLQGHQWREYFNLFIQPLFIQGGTVMAVHSVMHGCSVYTGLQQQKQNSNI